MTGLTIEPATDADLPLILEFIRDLATYERAPEAVVADEETLRASLFGPNPRAEALIAYVEGAAAAYAVHFTNFSTWTGRPGLYLEDLFVRPPFRRLGVGRALLVYLARLAVERRCARFEWAVLDWNQPAIDFYRTLGAEALDEWTVYRLSGDALARLAARDL